MFLDPEPKRPKTSNSRRSSTASSSVASTSTGDLANTYSRGDMSSGFFSSSRPIISPRDSNASTRRKALHQRSNSKNNEQLPSTILEQPTVRLVNPSPSPPQTQHADDEKGSSDSDEGAKENQQQQQQEQGARHRLPRSDWVEGASVSNPSISAAGRDQSVSETPLAANEVHSVDRAPSIALLPNNSQHELRTPIWHRRSTSSGDYSQSSTLQDSEIAFSKKSLKSERLSSLSQFSTLRGTPTPYEQDLRELAEADRADSSARVGPAQALETLQEASPEKPEERLSTIRPVPSSDTSSSSPTELGPAYQSQEASPTTIRLRPRSSPSDLEQTPHASNVRSRRTLSDGSLQSQPSIVNLRHIASSTPSHDQQRPESQAISERTFPYHSSPNFIAYSPDSAGPISRDPLRGATSIDSIHSRLQYQSVAARPGTTQSLANSSSWGSLQSDNTPPPLHIPKKRLRHKAGSESLKTQAGASDADETMADEEIDTLPYPKRPFSSHLSTIASESDRHSGGASQHLSHFSLGSGVLTGDDASSLPLSPAGHKRHSSAPGDSFAPSLGTRGTSSSEFQEDAGDMTLGIFREESAVPQPLFRAKSGPNASKQYDGPLPPIPPIPRDSEEHSDRLTALQGPQLRQKRSGYSIRQRSNSTPSHSRQQSQVSNADTERYSQGSSIFPTWAKHFYTGTAVLKSKVSLNSLSTMERRPTNANGHRRNESSWTERSITSQLGNGYNSATPSSPASSHFLPAIFRPRTRKRLGSQTRDSRSSGIRKSRRSRPSQDRPSQDSMAIRPVAAEGTEDVLPSGHPRYGVLKDNESPEPEHRGKLQRPLPRKYSKQRQWDQMEFPRPMTKDRLSDFGTHTPRLLPSKRASQNRLSAWQAPSFVSGLDTLFTSRCNRQILLFMLGFICPLTWMMGAVLPLPKKPISASDFETSVANSEEDVAMAMMKHEAGDAERRWREEKVYMKASWWRMLNRIMSVVGILVIGAVIALAIIATR